MKDLKKTTDDLEHDVLVKANYAEEQMEDAQRIYVAESVKRQESEKTIIELRHSMTLLQNLLKKTQSDHLKEMEQEDIKYQNILKEKHLEHVKLTKNDLLFWLFKAFHELDHETRIRWSNVYGNRKWETYVYDSLKVRC